MGQKVNPHGLRVGVIKEWDSKWYADKSNFGDNLVEDFKIRKVLKDVYKRQVVGSDLQIKIPQFLFYRHAVINSVILNPNRLLLHKDKFISVIG